MPLTFCERLVASCEKNSDKAAMRIVGIDDETYTFEQLLTRIRSVAYRLEQEGVEFGDRVIVMGENHPSWAIAYLGGGIPLALAFLAARGCHPAVRTFRRTARPAR